MSEVSEVSEFVVVFKMYLSELSGGESGTLGDQGLGDKLHPASCQCGVWRRVTGWVSGTSLYTKGKKPSVRVWTQ